MDVPLKVYDCISAVVGVAVARDGGLRGRKESAKEERRS